MFYIQLSLYGLLWMWLPLRHGQPIKNDLKADAIVLSKILLTRIQEHPTQVKYASSLKSSGLDFIPDEQILLSLEQIDEVLEVFQIILSNIPMEDVEQMLIDIENLRSVIQLLNRIMGCMGREPKHLNIVEDLKEQHKNASFTIEKVTLDRLQNSLQSIVQHLDYITGC
ncbi:leptin-like [Pseudophryne corroboree]|uniref:leptin-like n=1 Tax=Pseudophryne corroboree TaxID=495146 RepID=UPI0030815ABF